MLVWIRKQTIIGVYDARSKKAPDVMSVNLRNFTTEYTELHGGKMIFVPKLRGTPCPPWLTLINGAIYWRYSD